MGPRYTVSEIAEKLKVDKEVARGLVRFLLTTGFVTVQGDRKGGRGRAEIVYSFAENYENSLVSSLKEAKLS